MEALPPGTGGGEITSPGGEPEQGGQPPRGPETPLPAAPEITPPAYMSPAEINLSSEPGNAPPSPLPRDHARAIRASIIERGRQQNELTTGETRRAFLHRVGHLHNERGVNVRRTEDFIGALGLRSDAGVLIVDAENYDQVIAAAERVGEPIIAPGRGVYKSALGMILINRGSMTGDEIATTLVHEKGGHGDQPWVTPDGITYVKEFERRHQLPPVPVIGLCGIDPETGAVTGRFLDEGRAEWIALEYMRAIGAHDPANMQSIDGVKYGSNRGLYVPAATAFDLLFARDESLIEPTLNLGHDFGAVEETMARIDRIRPGLYDDLATIPYAGGESQLTADIRAFNRGLQIVMEATGFTDADTRPIVNHGPGAQYVAAQLQRQAVAESRQSNWYPHGRP